jgi:hypothetical protein
MTGSVTMSETICEGVPKFYNRKIVVAFQRVYMRCLIDLISSPPRSGEVPQIIIIAIASEQFIDSPRLFEDISVIWKAVRVWSELPQIFLGFSTSLSYVEFSDNISIILKTALCASKPSIASLLKAPWYSISSIWTMFHSALL